MIDNSLPSNKALSVRQPHAHLLVTPHPRAKDIPVKWCENRTWKPDLRQLTPSPLKEDAGLPRILIHASSNLDQNAFEEDEETGRWSDVPKFFRELDIDALPKSAIIGSVRLLGVIDVPQLFEELAGDDVDEDESDWDNNETPIQQYVKFRSKLGLKTSPKVLTLGVECVEPLPMYEGEELFWWFVDRPIPIEKPILGVKGKLNLWNYSG